MTPTAMKTDGVGQFCDWLNRRSIAEVEAAAAARAAARKAERKALLAAEREARLAVRLAELRRARRIPYAGADPHETQVQAYDWRR